MQFAAGLRWRSALLRAAVVLVLLGACSGDAGAARPAPTTAPDALGEAADDVDPVDVAALEEAARTAAGQVVIQGRAFDPATVTITAGDSVAWRFQDTFPTPHEVKGDRFASGAKVQGVFVHRFPTAGTFAYRCTVHPDMTGTVEVT